MEPNNYTFDFLKDPQKIQLLTRANESLNLHNSHHKCVVFVYTPPKVGSTSIVSSLRLFGSHLFDIIHIHDEEMLQVLGNIKGVTVNELIQFNKHLGKDVYVIDIYRSPIERKISAFFEKVGSYHFNNRDEQVNIYNVTKVINRFNNIFPHLAVGDHFIDKYGICVPEQFDWANKYLLVEDQGIKYIKLRLKDSAIWGQILSSIFQLRICIVKDYETTNKPIKDLFGLFKTHYKIPINFLTMLMDCKYFNYYYSPEERQEYYDEWSKKSCETRSWYTAEQFRLYDEITRENVHIDYVQVDHYLDEGCMCKACGIKRAELASKVVRGLPIGERVVHTEAKTQLIQRRTTHVNKLNQALQHIQMMPRKIRGKDFNSEMTSIVKGNK
jgi:hypothetical protein